MKADLSHQDAHAPDAMQTSAPTHDHTHEHAHGHTHDHRQAHRHAADHGTHTHAAKAPLAHPTSESRASLLMRSALLRLVGAVALSALLWTAVAWALSGTP